MRGCVSIAQQRHSGLSFKPVATERYEIAIRREHLDDPRVAELCSSLTSPAFKEIMGRLGGYDTTEDRRAACTALITASSGVAHFTTPSISHVFKPNTGAGLSSTRWQSPRESRNLPRSR